MTTVVSLEFERSNHSSDPNEEELSSKLSALNIGNKQGSFLLKSDEPERKVSWKISDDPEAVIFDHKSSDVGRPTGSADEQDGDMESIAKNLDRPLSLHPESQYVTAMKFPVLDTDSMWSSVVEQPEQIVEPLTRFIYDNGQGKLVRIDKELFKTYVQFREKTDQDLLQQSLNKEAEQRRLAQILRLPEGERLTAVDFNTGNAESNNYSGYTTITMQRVIERTRLYQEVSCITTHGGKLETPVDSPDATPFNTIPNFASSNPALKMSPQETGTGVEESPPWTEFSATKDEGSNADSNQNVYLLLMDLAERVAGDGRCTLRELAFRLDFEEVHIRQIEETRPGDLQMQFYELLRGHLSKYPKPINAYPKLLLALEGKGQHATASWFKKQYQEKEASLRSDDDCGRGTTSEFVPPRKQPPLYYDICLKHSGNAEHLEKFENILRNQSWKVFKFDESETLGAPVMEYISRILKTSSHLVLLIDEDECRSYEEVGTTSMTLEMAFSLANCRKELTGRIIPIRCCDEMLLPLSLQALTGANIDDEKLGTKLARTVDPSIRKKREEMRRKTESSKKMMTTK